MIWRYATLMIPLLRLLDWAAMAKHRAKRYAESIANNANFYFGPRQILTYCKQRCCSHDTPTEA
jgi:hypothetical protein